ncbi:MAG: asparaginase [Candidatus Puniceispirillaceae bacterium]
MAKQVPKFLPYTSDEPLKVSFNREGVTESLHEVDIAICDGNGAVLFGMGDYTGQMFPRSAMKPLQALCLIEMLIDNKTLPKLTPSDISLICASHNGEPAHTDAVHGLLAKFDINADDLICGAHWSLEQSSLIEQVRGFDQPGKVHNNCSGKHAGMMILAKLLTGSTDHYAEITHKAQKAIHTKLAQMTGEALEENVVAIDGCGAPIYRAPLHSWAKAFALFAGGGAISGATKDACAIIRDSIAAKPYLMAGRNRACSAINACFENRITVKVGAEGVYSAAFHEFQLGMMLKARDGNKRGAEVALGAICNMFGYQGDESAKAYFHPKLTNWAGAVTGDVSLLNMPHA